MKSSAPLFLELEGDPPRGIVTTLLRYCAWRVSVPGSASTDGRSRWSWLLWVDFLFYPLIVIAAIVGYGSECGSLGRDGLTLGCSDDIGIWPLSGIVLAVSITSLLAVMVGAVVTLAIRRRPTSLGYGTWASIGFLWIAMPAPDYLSLPEPYLWWFIALTALLGIPAGVSVARTPLAE